MKKNWLWILGIALTLIVLFALSFVWRLFMPFGGYGMMRHGYGYGMPMMGYSYNTIPFHRVLFMWLIPFGMLSLIVLGIVWLMKQLTKKS